MEANWISVKDRLPDVDCKVWIAFREYADKIVVVESYFYVNSGFDSFYEHGITHWMTFIKPAPPLTNH